LSNITIFAGLEGEVHRFDSSKASVM